MKLKLLTLLIGVLLFLLLRLPAFAAMFGRETQLLWCALPEKDARLLAEMVENYNLTQKNLTFVVQNFHSEEELFKALSQKKELPNLAVIPSTWQGELIKAGVLAPIEEQMEKMGSTVRVMSKMDTFKPLIKGCTINEVLWTFPFYARSWALLGEEDFLDLAAFDKPPAYWDELVLLGKKLSDKPSAPPLFHLPIQNPYLLGHLYRLFLWQTGKEVYDYETKELGFAGKEGEYTLGFWQNLLKNGIAKKGEGEDAVLYFGTIADLLSLEDQGKRIKVSALPLLKGKIKRAVSPVSCYSIALFKKTPKNMEKAFHLAYYLREFPQNLKWALHTPCLPAHKQVVMSPEYFQFLQLHPGVRTFLQVLDFGKVDPPDLSYQEILKKLGEEIRKALQEEQAAKPALESVRKQSETLIRSSR